MTFSAGWRWRSSVSSTSPPPPSSAISREQERDVDASGVERLVGQRAAGVEGDDVAEGDAVDLLEPDEAERAALALGRSAEDERVGHVGEVAQRLQVVLARRSPRRPRRRWRPAPARARGRARRGRRRRARGRSFVDVGSVSGRYSPRAQELDCSAGVLGHEVDQPPDQRRDDQLARPQVEDPLDLVALRFEGLAVDLGQQFALGEVERGDGDRVGIVRGRAAPFPARSCTPRSPTTRRRLRVRLEVDSFPPPSPRSCASLAQVRDRGKQVGWWPQSSDTCADART